MPLNGSIVGTNVNQNYHVLKKPSPCRFHLSFALFKNHKLQPNYCLEIIILLPFGLVLNNLYGYA